MPTRLLSLPDVTGIATCAINPFQAQSVAATTALCEAYGIALPTTKHYITMSSYLFPTASLERLKAIDLLNAILFYIDDSYEGSTKNSGATVSGLGDSRCGRVSQSGSTRWHSVSWYRCMILGLVYGRIKKQ